jgi:hypothetical protein
MFHPATSRGGRKTTATIIVLVVAMLTDFRVGSVHPSISDTTSRRGERRKVPLAIIFVGRTEIVHMPIEAIGASTSGCGGTTRRKQEIAERML